MDLKYLKYKNKYISLKNTLNMKGGTHEENIRLYTKFIALYDKVFNTRERYGLIINNMSSHDFFLKIYSLLLKLDEKIFESYSMKRDIIKYENEITEKTKLSKIQEPLKKMQVQKKSIEDRIASLSQEGNIQELEKNRTILKQIESNITSTIAKEMETLENVTEINIRKIDINKQNIESIEPILKKLKNDISKEFEILFDKLKILYIESEDNFKSMCADIAHMIIYEFTPDINRQGNISRLHSSYKPLSYIWARCVHMYKHFNFGNLRNYLPNVIMAYMTHKCSIVIPCNIINIPNGNNSINLYCVEMYGCALALSGCVEEAFNWLEQIHDTPIINILTTGENYQNVYINRFVINTNSMLLRNNQDRYNALIDQLELKFNRISRYTNHIDYSNIPILSILPPLPRLYDILELDTMLAFQTAIIRDVNTKRQDAIQKGTTQPRMYSRGIPQELWHMIGTEFL